MAPECAPDRGAEVRLAPLPLWRSRWVTRRIELTGPAAALERLADGRANWVFTLPESGEPSPWVLDINEIGFDKGSVGLTDAILQADLTVLVDPLGKPVPFADVAGAAFVPEDAAAASPRDYVFGWKVKGKYKGLPTQGEGKVGGMLALQDPRQPFPVQADVTIGGTKAAVTGTLTDPATLGALDLRLKLSGGSMAQLYPLTGVTLPDTPPYSTDGHLVAKLRNAGGAVFDYRDFNGRVGSSDLHGDLSFSLAAPRPKLTGKLSSKQLRMADLGPLTGVQSGKSAPAQQQPQRPPANPPRRTVQPVPELPPPRRRSLATHVAPAPRPITHRPTPPRATLRRHRVLPVQEFRTDRWRDMDADVALEAGRIVHDAKLPLSDLSVHLVLQDGQLTLDPLRFGMAGGSMAATVRLDGSKAPLTGRVEMHARRLRLKQLFPAAESMQKTLGELNGDLALAGTGNSVAALLGSADGDVKMLVNDGVISRSLMEIAGLNVGNYVVSKLFGDDEVKINCGAADLEMKRGVMTPRVFVFDTENALINITGTTDFKNEKLDLDITPDSKGFRIFSLRSPLYVRGTFGKPDVGVHVGPLAARGAGMVALGVILTPAAGLLALIAPSTTDDNSCGTLLKQMRTPPKAPAPKGK
ncbi:AsmA family protein [Achromobacter ruhlandii]|uniref:AsmA family protein n=1 Tax=Achromobacter ruhlandii TaxID=72557 RepID=UPI003D23B4B7